MKFLSKILFLLLLIPWFNIQSQVIGGTNDKLAKLYNSGKYESCLLKADNLTYNEATSRDPEPYLYAAMCFFELSKSEDPIIREDYKDGLKQAIKYASKFAKKDKEGEMYSDNIEFINELKSAQYAEVKEYFDNADYKKSGTSAKIYNKLNREEDLVVLYFISICELLSNNTQGNRDMDEAKKGLDPLIASGKIKFDPKFKPLVSSGFLKYSEYLVGQNQLKEAVDILKFGMKLMPNEGFLKVQLNMIEKKLTPKNDSIPTKM